MDYILKGRGQGKTYELIMRSSKTGEVIVCYNKTMARYINETAQKMGIFIPEATHYRNVINGCLCGTSEEIVIDEVGYILNDLFGCKVNAVTDMPDKVDLKFSK